MITKNVRARSLKKGDVLILPSSRNRRVLESYNRTVRDQNWGNPITSKTTYVVVTDSRGRGIEVLEYPQGKIVTVNSPDYNNN